MALKIVKASDPIPVDQIVVCLYGPPATWKTSLSFTASAPLLLDFDEGVYRAKYRRDAVICKTWNDAEMSADDIKDYKTIIVDTAGRSLDKLSADIIRREPKLGKNGALTLQGFGRLKTEFTAWLKFLRSFGADIILLAHVDESHQGDDTIERIDAQGSSKNEIYKSADAMGRLAIRDGKRVLMFSPTDTAFGKNPANLAPLIIPQFGPDSTFLGDVIHDIKAHLNAMSEEQREVGQLLSEWGTKINAANGAKQLTDLVMAVDELDPRVRENAKRMLWSFAKDRGLTYDKTKGFIEKAEKVPA